MVVIEVTAHDRFWLFLIYTGTGRWSEYPARTRVLLSSSLHRAAGSKYRTSDGKDQLSTSSKCSSTLVVIAFNNEKKLNTFVKRKTEHQIFLNWDTPQL